MTEEELLLKNRFSELARRAYSRVCYVYSDFLNISEQDTLRRMSFEKGSAKYRLFGGYGTSERNIACFGDEDLCGYADTPPIVCIRISPVSLKFADELSHRDILGSVLALGFKRNVIGDIVLNGDLVFLFCLDSVSDYIIENLTRVSNTSVKCRISETPDIAANLPEPENINTASERLDAIIASVYKLSRSESQRLFIQGKVYINSRLTESTSISPGHGAIISVRGLGRFIYEGIERETKKGRLMVKVRIY
jgi:Uncharacterized conserved protein, contains S4-like domain